MSEDKWRNAKKEINIETEANGLKEVSALSKDQLKAIIEVQKAMARLNEVGMVVFGDNEIYDGKLITFKREVLRERKSGESEIIWTKERLDWIEYATIRCPYLDGIEVAT